MLWYSGRKNIDKIWRIKLSVRRDNSKTLLGVSTVTVFSTVFCQKSDIHYYWKYLETDITLVSSLYHGEWRRMNIPLNIEAEWFLANFVFKKPKETTSNDEGEKQQMLCNVWYQMFDGNC